LILLGVTPTGYDAGRLFIYDVEALQQPIDGLNYHLKEVFRDYCPASMRIWSLAAEVDDSESLKICATAFEYLEPGERIYQNCLDFIPGIGV
jgi:hypothetical protein